MSCKGVDSAGSYQRWLQRPAKRRLPLRQRRNSLSTSFICSSLPFHRDRNALLVSQRSRICCKSKRL